MTYTSLAFAAFVTILYLIYYIVPKKNQWIVLLLGSIFFYVFATKIYSVFILSTIITIYLGSNKIESIHWKAKAEVKAHKEIWTKEEKRNYKDSMEKKAKATLVLVLVFNFGILGVIKYFGPALGGILLPLGISFYTFQSTGYLIDVYRENVDAEKNIFKLALFISFFPQIVQGPIGEFEKLQGQLTEEHKLSWDNFKHGINLILWGLFKKLIIADRSLKVITIFLQGEGTEAYPHTGEYSGTAVLFVLTMYALQLYTDFSGGIDISRGVSKLFGIDLAMNFRQPYFATTLSDYWRRWHITLGAWMKKYVFYSLATSSPFLNMGRSLSKGSGSDTSPFKKHVAKVLPSAIATFIVFILVGIWHGSNLKYLGFGIWNGLVLMVSLIAEPIFISWRERLGINERSHPHRLFQMVRTFILVLIGYAFDVGTDLAHALNMLWSMLFFQRFPGLFDELSTLGLGKIDYGIILAGSLVLLYFSIRMEKEGIDSIGELLTRRSGIIQWLVILASIIGILTFGIYGPGYDAADFVYMQF